MQSSRFIHYKASKKYCWCLLLAAWLGVLLIGVMHAVTGPRIGLYSFYLIPILFVTWFAGPRWGTWTAVFSVADWLATDMQFTKAWPIEAAVWINESIRFGMYLLLVFVTTQWRKALDREASLARLDPLTQLPNRRAFFERAGVELERARRYHRPLTAVMLDLDDFKAINDQLGHQRGDDVLRVISRIIHATIRATDVPGRLGGDEFALILPETDATAAQVFAGKLRRAMLESLQAEQWPVTISFGVATFHAMPPHVDQLLKRADELLYAAKGRGKNESCCAVVEAADG